jgi:hypothetical protein
MEEGEAQGIVVPAKVSRTSERGTAPKTVREGEQE